MANLYNIKMQFYYYLALILLLAQFSHSQELLTDEEPLFHVEDIKFPLFTHNNTIVDATGKRVKLAGGNYGGSHLERQCVSGLQERPLKDIAMDVRFKFKMNVIRLTYSLQMIFSNTVVPSQFLKANPNLVGKTTLEIFDFAVKTFTDVGLMVFLNNHISSSKWCCSDTDGNGLWYTKQYPEAKYFEHVQLFAKRYKSNERVIGIDLRNEIRKANGTNPTWGNGDAKTDWKKAAQTAGEVALRQAPHWLIIIGGLNYQLDLTGVQHSPIELSVRNKLVYSGHLYGFSWSANSYDDFKARLFKTQTYVRQLGVPYLLGEFGNNQKDNYWNWLIAYLKETSIDWTYWVIDGYKGDPAHDETYGVFNKDFVTIRHPDLLADMISVGPTATALKDYPKYEALKTKELYGSNPIEQII